MVRNRLLCLGLVLLMAIGLFPEMVCEEAEAANVTWVETTYDCERSIKVKTSSHTYINRIKQGTNWWTAHRIDKDTWIGTVVMSVSASRTESHTPYTSYAGVNYGATWGNSYDIFITMQPRSSFTINPYTASNYEMTDAKIWVPGTKKTVYSASEDLVNWCYTLNSVSTGFLQDWAPKEKNDTSGWDNIDMSFGVSLKDRSFNINLGKKITIKNEYVKGYDDTTMAYGRYRTRYDYKKYNGIGYCSSGRKEKVFGFTTVHDSVYWRNKSKRFSGYVYATATFTVCDSKSWPEELVSASANIMSRKMIIE